MAKKKVKHNKPDPRPYLRKDGSPDRRFSVSRFLRNDGHKRKNINFPSGVRSIPSLYKYLSPLTVRKHMLEQKREQHKIKEPKRPLKKTPSVHTTTKPVGKKVRAKQPVPKGKQIKPNRGKAVKKPVAVRGKKQEGKRGRRKDIPWLNKDGSVDQRLEIKKYLTKDGRLKKNRKLPPGVKTIPELWDYLNSKKVTAEKKGLICAKYVTIVPHFWPDWLETNWPRFRKVFMGDKLLKTFDELLLYIDDYLNELIEAQKADRTKHTKDKSTKSPDIEIVYTICRDRLYEYLYF